MKTNSLPTATQSVLAVWKRNFIQFKKTWLISLFWIVLEPSFVLGALGFGLGRYVNSVGGQSYLEFFFPALLCNSVMMIAFYESTYANYTKLSYSKLYQSILLTPVEPEHLLWGEVLWAASKALLSAMGIMVVALFFGAIGSWTILLALPGLFLTGMIFSCIGMIVTSRVRNYDQIIYPSSGLIIPLSLFSGTYFPLESLPKPLFYLAQLSPLTHAVALTRGLQMNVFGVVGGVHLFVVLILSAALYRVALRFFSSRLSE